MNILQVSGRRRQFLQPEIVTVTFNGNGGTTAGGQVTVSMKVLQGTLLKDITGTPQFIQGSYFNAMSGWGLSPDDNDVLPDDFHLTGNVTLYALYGIVEVGFITHTGEMITAQAWIDKYGTDLYENTGFQNANGWWDMNAWELKDGAKDNLVEFMFFKDGAEMFGIPIDYVSLVYNQIGGYSVSGALAGFDSGNYTIPGALLTPAQVDEINALRTADAIQISLMRKNALAGKTDNYGTVGSPPLEFYLGGAWQYPVEASKFFYPAPYHCKILAGNAQKIWNQLKLLVEWQTVDNGGKYVKRFGRTTSDYYYIALAYNYFTDYTVGTGANRVSNGQKVARGFASTMQIFGNYLNDVNGGINISPDRHIFCAPNYYTGSVNLQMKVTLSRAGNNGFLEENSMTPVLHTINAADGLVMHDFSHLL
jgi:hypothetical protein